MKKAKSALQPGAPALEKGLDLLEALAAEARGPEPEAARSYASADRSAKYSECLLRWSVEAMSRAIR